MLFNPTIITATPHGRAGNARCCANCGRPINPKRSSRRQRYCNYRCRDEARRARDFAGRYPAQAIPRSVENRPLVSNTCKGDFADRAYSISGPHDVIASELIAGRDWRSVISADGIPCKVAQVAARRA
jgi:hypothetical protein